MVSSWMSVLASAVLLGASPALAFGPGQQRQLLPGRFMELPSKAPKYGNATFTQYIDHNNPHLGTFEQFYYWSDEFWAGPGSPVIIMTPGEVAADGYDGYLYNITLPGAIAQAVGGATIVIEHRYWGQSSPYDSLTTENLQYLTLDQAVQDLVHFAKTVKLPFVPAHAKNDNTAGVAPWILVGGSYAGALTGWVEATAPGTFWAYQASSAVVETVANFWQYFVPVQEAMPKNCSTDVSRVIDYMDNVMQHGSAKQIHDLKNKFGLAAVEHNDDFMDALAIGPFGWQATDFYTSGSFFEWCDYVENSVNQTDKSKLPGPNGVGLQKALDGYAAWFKSVTFPNPCAGYPYADFQGPNNLACFNSYNASSPIYHDLSVGNPDERQWLWMLCNQPFEFWQTGAPSGTPSLVSRLVTVEYNTRICGLYFGNTVGVDSGRTTSQVNAYTKGWFNDHSTRLSYTNGQWDPWRYATVSSGSRPGGPLQSTSQVPVQVIPQGRHCSDLLMVNGEINAGAHAVQNAEIANMVRWVSEYPKQAQPY